MTISSTEQSVCRLSTHISSPHTYAICRLHMYQATSPPKSINQQNHHPSQAPPSRLSSTSHQSVTRSFRSVPGPTPQSSTRFPHLAALAQPRPSSRRFSLCMDESGLHGGASMRVGTVPFCRVRGKAVGVGMRAIGIEHKDGETLPLRWDFWFLTYLPPYRLLGLSSSGSFFLFSQTGLRSVNQEVVRRVHRVVPPVTRFDGLYYLLHLFTPEVVLIF